MILGYFDGAAKPNPGRGGAGAYIDVNGEIFWEDYRYLGDNITNNEAEYKALIMLLEATGALGIKEITIRGDSQLVINQMTEKWGISEPRLRLLQIRAWELIFEYEIKVKFEWIPRERNKRADILSNLALTEKGDEAND